MNLTNKDLEKALKRRCKESKRKKELEKARIEKINRKLGIRTEKTKKRGITINGLTIIGMLIYLIYMFQEPLLLLFKKYLY